MARVVFSALIDEIAGKLGGSVFQNSYGGYQLRSKVVPRNPRAPGQQLRRGDFGYIAQLWRTLSSTDRSSWTDNAPDGSSGFNFFVQSNVNLSLIGLPPIAAYASGSAPDAFPMIVSSASTTDLSVHANSAVVDVPAATSLILFASNQYLPGKAFIPVSAYTSIATFAAGTHFMDPVDVLPYWLMLYLTPIPGNNIFLKSVLISTVNGSKGAEYLFNTVIA